MSILAEAIKKLDPTPNKLTELTLALGLLSELSENKVLEFKNEVESSYRTAGTDENRTAPITTIVATHSEYRAYVKDDAGKIPGEVASSIKKFVSGGSENIITGIADLVTTAITAILGSGQATQQEVRSYYITVQARALVRYDILAWRRLVEAQGITTQIQACMAIYASKASIDVSALDLNTFLLAYEDQLTKMNFTDKETLAYIDQAEEIYKKLRGEGASEFAAPARAMVLSGASRAARPQRPSEPVFFPAMSK